MKKNPVALALVAVLGVTTFGASAQQAAGPAGVPWGPVMVYPTVDLAYKHNDNIFSQPDGVGKKRSDITVIAPMARLEAKTGPHTFGLTARVEDGTYHNSRSDNYTDFQLGADASWAFSGRAGLKLRADYNQGHDDRGSVVGAGVGATPDRYQTTGVAGVFGYGAEGAQGRIEVDAGYLTKRYDNNQFLSATTGTRFYDRDETRYGATFFWKVMPKTQVLVQAGQTHFDYNNGTYQSAGLTVRDSVETRYLLGVTWEATYATTGIFKVGQVDKNFKNSSVPDFSGMTWEGIVKWRPLSYSGVDFYANRKPSEASLGSATFDTTTGLAWNHAWNSRLASTLSYSHLRQDYKGLGFDRRDSTDFYGAKLTYQVQRWLKLGAGYDFADKSSTAPLGGYDRNIFTVFLTGSL